MIIYDYNNIKVQEFEEKDHFSYLVSDIGNYEFRFTSNIKLDNLFITDIAKDFKSIVKLKDLPIFKKLFNQLYQKIMNYNNKKYWTEIKKSNLNYKEAINLMQKENEFITRPEWLGFHFMSKNNEYCILLKTGEIINNATDIWDIDKNDWITVSISYEAKQIINHLI